MLKLYKSHHKLSHERNHTDQFHQEVREDKDENAINRNEPPQRESRGTESKEVRTHVDHEWMHQIDTKTVIGKIEDYTSHL